MSCSRQRGAYTRGVCPNKNYLPKIGVNEVDPPGPIPRPRPRYLRRRRPPPLCSQRKRRSRFSIPPRNRSARTTRFCAWRLRRTRRPRARARSRPRRRSRCRRRTTARCTAASATCRCTRTRRRRGSTYSCMRCGIRLVLGCLRRRCLSGLRKGGSGSVLLEGGIGSIAVASLCYRSTGLPFCGCSVSFTDRLGSASAPEASSTHLEIDRDIGGKHFPHDTIEILSNLFSTEPSNRESQYQYRFPTIQYHLLSIVHPALHWELEPLHREVTRRTSLSPARRPGTGRAAGVPQARGACPVHVRRGWRACASLRSPRDTSFDKNASATISAYLTIK